MPAHQFSTLPARRVEPDDRIENHDYERCWSCGEWVSDWGCRCDEIELEIDDLREQGDG